MPDVCRWCVVSWSAGSRGSTEVTWRRWVPLPRFLVEDLAEHIGGKASDELVFASPKGAVLRVRGARRSWFDRAVVTSGVPEGFHPHELRHTAASLAVSAGANVKAVQRMLGHAKASMTLDVYADLFDDDLEAVAERLDAIARGRSADHLRTTEIIPLPAEGLQVADLRLFRWRRRDLNPQPPPCKGGAGVQVSCTKPGLTCTFAVGDRWLAGANCGCAVGAVWARIVSARGRPAPGTPAVR